MKTVEDIARNVDGLRLDRGDSETVVEALTNDSRTAQKGTLFVAVRGQQVDGHDFVDSAIDNGASAILVDEDFSSPPDGVAVLRAVDTRSMLGPVSSFFFDYPSRQLDVIGITGTNGKTSTSYLLESIFDCAGLAPGIIGTIEYRWADRRIAAVNTTPDGLSLHRTLRKMADDGVQVAIVEVSSHGLALGRIDGTCFAAALFTNLSRDHIGFHGSIKAYRRAKWRLFDTCLVAEARPEQSPVAVINVDADEGRRLADEVGARNDLTVATHCTKAQGDGPSGVDAEFRARNIECTIDGNSMVVEESNEKSYDVAVSVPGRFNAENALGALSVARMLGVDVEDVVDGLARFDGVPGRMQRIEDEKNEPSPAVFVDYAHTPDALCRALKTLRPLTEGRLWVVFGCGGDRDVSKRAPMGRAAARLAEEVIVTSDNPRSEQPESIIDDVVEGIETVSSSAQDTVAKWTRQGDRRRAIEDAILRAAHRDVILIAGKGHETYQEQNGTRRDFDDRRVALDVLRRRGDESWGG